MFMLFILIQLLLTVFHCVCIVIESPITIDFERFIPNRRTSTTFDIVFKDVTTEYILLTINPLNMNHKYKFIITSKEEYAIEYSTNIIAEAPYNIGSRYILLNRRHLNLQTYNQTYTDIFWCFIKGPNNMVLQGNFSVSYYNEIPLQLNSDISYITFDHYHSSYVFRYTRTKESNDYINIYALGGTDNQVTMTLTYVNGSNVDIISKDKAFYNGDVVEIEESNYVYNDGAYFRIDVHSYQGVAVRVGVYDIRKVNMLKPNQPASYAYFNTSKLTHKAKCYEVNIGDGDITDDNEYYVSVVTRTLNTFVFLTNTTYSDDCGNSNSNVKHLLKANEYHVNEVISFSFKTSLIREYPYLCFSFINTGPNIAYSVQILNITNINNVSIITEPLINGLTYIYTLKPNETQIFTRSKFDTRIDTVTVNFRSEEGELDTYIVSVNNYPDTTISNTTFTTPHELPSYIPSYQKLININGFSTYKLGKPIGEHSLSPNQTLAVATCAITSLIPCVFEVSFADHNDFLHIEPNNRYTQVQTKGQIDQFTFRITDNTVNKVVIELSTYTGDSNMEIIKSTPIPRNISSFYIGNKEVVEIHKSSINISDINGIYQITITATTNNMYTVGYFLFKENESNTVLIDSSMQVLEYIELGNSKMFVMKNIYHFLKIPWITTFTPVNCDIEVSFIYNNITRKLPFNTDDFLQHYINYDNDALNSLNFTYNVKAFKRKEQHYAKYDKCLLYITGFALTNKTELVVNEAVPFKLNLNKDKPSVNLFYPRSSSSGNVLAYVNVESDMPIYLSFTINGKHYIEHSFTRSKQIQLGYEELEVCDSHHRSGQICPIVITVSGQDKEGLNPMKTQIQFEFAIKTQNAVPIYLQKNKLQKEFSFIKSYQYFITDITKDEYGEIFVNYLRGSGRPYVKILPKEISEDDADWNGKVVLPKTNTVNLIGQYDSYTRSLKYTKENTHKCAYGCDMYIGVLSDEVYATDSVAFSNEFSIYIRSLPSTNIVDIPINEYIYGAMYSIEQKDYYSFNLPIDIDKIIIELQCETCEIYVNKGSNIPTRTKKDYSFKSNGIDSVHVINLKTTESSFKMRFTIMVTVTAMEAFYTQLYNFRVRVHKINAVELVEVTSDQSALCEVKEVNGYCDFIILSKESEILNSLLLYAYGQSSSNIVFYVKTIDSEIFDFYNEQQKRNALPRDNSTDPTVFTSKNNFNTNFINVNEIQKFNKNILISIKSSKPTLITLLSTFRTYLYQMTPNPSSVLLYEINEHSLNTQINLIIPNNNNYIVHVVCIDGIGSVGLVNDSSSKHELIGRHDSLMFNTIKKHNATFYIKNEHPDKETLIVYFWYHVTSGSRHFDEIQFGQTGEVYYTGYDFPIDNYVRIDKAEGDVVVNLDFFKMNNNTLNESLSQVDYLDIKGYVVSQKFIHDKLSNLNILPNDNDAINGLYDPTTKKGSIVFDKVKLQLIQNEIVYLLININKGSGNNKTYNVVHYEISVLPTSGVDIEMPVKYYQTSLLNNNARSNYHMLRKTMPTDKTLVLEFAANSPKVHFAYSIHAFTLNANSNLINTNSSEILLNEIYYGGKHVLSFDMTNHKELYVSVFTNENLNTNAGRYIMKYTYDVDVVKYEIGSITLDQNDTYTGTLPKVLLISVNPITYGNNVTVVNCIYHLKIYRYSKYEKGDNFNSINTPQTQLYFADAIASSNINDTIVFNVSLEYNDGYNITVDATVIDNNELISYESTWFMVKSPDMDPEQKEKRNQLIRIIVTIIIIVVVLLSVILILIVVFKLKNKKSNGKDVITSICSNEQLIPNFDESFRSNEF